nr:DNA-directed RNA polymerase subunit delta [Bacillus alkalicola]
MLEITYELLKESKTNTDYYALLKEVAKVKGLTEEEVTNRIAHLYTEMSVDGRFVNLGDNQWGLRSWFPFDQTEEELSQTNKPRKKKKRTEDEEDEDYLVDDEEDFDEFEDLEDELDELANEEDFDEDKEEDTDLDEDFDEDEEEIEAESDEEDLL